MKLNNFVDKIYCINLDRRKDRWDRTKSIFEKYEIDVERFSAIDGKNCEYLNKNLKPGEIGLIKTNLSIFKIAKEKGYQNILIFEDDVELKDNFNILFEEKIFKIPDDWELIYFGGNHMHGLTPINESVAKIFGSYATHAVIFKNSLFDEIIESLTNEEQQIDVVYAKMQQYHSSYVFTPHLAWQRNDFSDIQEKDVDYSFLI